MTLSRLLAILILLSSAGCATDLEPGPNILLITLDTTRADHLSLYGYERKTSPNLDLLAAESVVYNRAIAPAGWTLPSHASLFTGKFTTSHGARYDPQGPLRLAAAIDGAERFDGYRARGLAPGQPTLAHLLREHGYRTGAVLGGPWLERVFGLAQGFDHYDDSQIDSLNGRRANQVTDAALEWLGSIRRDDSYFLFLNYFDAHGPHDPPEPFAHAFFSGTEVPPWDDRTLDEVNAFYDAEILFMDDQIGRLLNGLIAMGLYDNTWIIVTADHGELLTEHSEIGHGTLLYEEVVHVPFFMRYPEDNRPRGLREERVQLVDVLPMVCDRLGIAVPDGIQGTWPPENHPVISEAYPLEAFTSTGSWQALYHDNYKLLLNGDGSQQLFDLEADPAEETNLSSTLEGLARKMASELTSYLKQLPEPGPAVVEELGEDTRRRLRGLGYVQ